MDYEDLADQVLAIDDSKSRADVIADLKHTKSSEETLNRIYDGEFLQGIKVQVAVKKQESPSSQALMILDSDEEEEMYSDLPPVEETTTQRSKFEDFFDQENEELLLSTSTLQDTTLDMDDDLFSTSLRKTKEKPRDFFDFEDLTPPLNSKLSSQESIEDMTTPSSSKFNLLSQSPPPTSSNKRKYTLDDTDDEILFTETRFSLSPTRKTSFPFDDSDGDKDPFALDENTFDLTQKVRRASPTADSNSISLIDSDSDHDFDDDKDPFALDEDTFDLTQKVRRASPTTDSNSISLIDSDSENGSLPSINGDLISVLTKKPKVFDVEDTSITDRKGKGRADISNTAFLSLDDDIDLSLLSAKERKKIEAERRKEERKRLSEEKKKKKLEQLEERKRLKEQKQFEKERTQILEKENRIKANRNEILKEMIVDMHPDFVTTKAGELLKLVLDKKEAQVTLMENTASKHHIAWRRICSSEWNPDTLTFVPFASPKIVREPYALVNVDIYDFVARVKADTVDDYIDDIQRSLKDNKIQIMLLMEGLDTYYRKKLNFTKRQFQSQVRSSIEGENTATTRKTNSRQAEIENGPHRKQVEECINYLQIMRDIMFVPTKNDEDTASWIESLTTDLALGRYKSKNVNNAYKVSKCGTNARDTFHKMLQEIQLCTPAVADSVMGEYPTLKALHLAYERKTALQGELLLADLEVERSVLHTRDRKVNRVMSKKIYTVFTSDNPDQIIY